MRKAVLDPDFLEDLLYWQKIDPKLAFRIIKMMREVLKSPFEGIGKPEPLKGIGSDVWSRRLTQEHRMVYVVKDTQIDFLQARYHYED
jgi:toxin YoeB